MGEGSAGGVGISLVRGLREAEHRGKESSPGGESQSRAQDSRVSSRGRGGPPCGEDLQARGCCWDLRSEWVAQPGAEWLWNKAGG